MGRAAVRFSGRCALLLATPGAWHARFRSTSLQQKVVPWAPSSRSAASGWPRRSTASCSRREKNRKKDNAQREGTEEKHKKKCNVSIFDLMRCFYYTLASAPNHHLILLHPGFSAKPPPNSPPSPAVVTHCVSRLEGVIRRRDVLNKVITNDWQFLEDISANSGNIREEIESSETSDSTESTKSQTQSRSTLECPTVDVYRNLIFGAKFGLVSGITRPASWRGDTSRGVEICWRCWHVEVVGIACCCCC